MASETFVDLGKRLLHKEAMSDDFAHTLKRLREEKKLSQQDIGRALGVSRAAIGQWERGLTTPTFDNMQALMKLFGKVEGFTSIKDASDASIGLGLARIATPSPFSSPDDENIPVKFFSYGPDAYVFAAAEMAFDFILRVPFLENDPQAYGVAIVSDAMSPRFEIGETIYVTPDFTPSIGEYGVFEIDPGDGKGSYNCLRRLIADTGDNWVILKLKPSDTHTVHKSMMKSMHRVVPWNELIELPAS